jgi:hypothetical protein
MILRILFAAALMSTFLQAQPSVQGVLGIPAQPGQTVSAIASDLSGNMIVVGTITTGGGISGKVIKLDGEGALLYSLSVPGLAVAAMRVAVDANSDIYVTGLGGQGAFIAKFRGSDGSSVYNVSLGGVLAPDGIAVDSNGEAVVALNDTGAALTPTPGGYASPTGGVMTSYVFVAKLSASGQLRFIARYGGFDWICTMPVSREMVSGPVTAGAQILLDGSGHIWLVGSTDTTNLPVTKNALRSTCGCGQYLDDGFLAEFSADGASLRMAPA